METACVSVDSDVALYAGTFTDVQGSSFFRDFGPFQVGNTVRFYLKDNGQSAKAPLDQYASSLTICTFPIECEELSVSQDLIWFDIEGEDANVKVN